MDEIAKKETFAVAVPTSGWGAGEQIGQNDIIIPKIYLMQAISDLVEAEKAKAGDWVDSIEETILAEREEPLEVIIFDSFKNWNVLNVTKDGKTEFDHVEPYDSKTCDYPFDGFDDEGNPIRRQLQYNFYCLLPDMIEETPFVLSLSKTATTAAKRINTLFAKLTRTGKPSAAVVLALTSVKESNDKGTWYGISVGKSRETTAKEMAVAYDWYVQVRNSDKIKVHEETADDSELPF